MNNYLRELKYYPLYLFRENFDGIEEIPLPEGYHYEYYEDGDRENWISIETSAGEFILYEEGVRAWNTFFAGKEEDLRKRMYFVVNPQGEKVATASAFYNHTDDGVTGWLHWVAVRKEEQGKGIAKPLISKVFCRLRELGYQHILIPTQTTSWLAVRLYLNFGFTPLPENAKKSYDGYRIVRSFFDHPALKDFPPMPKDQIWDPVVRAVTEQIRAEYPAVGEIKVWQGDKGQKAAFKDGETIRCCRYEIAENKVTLMLQNQLDF